MASTRNTSHVLHGVLIPDGRLTYANLSASDSSYTQAGPKAGGVGVPSTAYAPAVIESLGAQEDTLVVEVTQGGYPALDMRVNYRLSTEATTARRAWNAPNLITGWYDLQVTEGANAIIDAITLGTGNILYAYLVPSSSMSFAILEVDNGEVNDYASVISSDGPFSSSVALCRQPSGHVLVLTNSEKLGWVIYRSTTPDFEASAVTRHTQRPFNTAALTDALRARLLYLQAEDTYCYIHAYAGTFKQYASNDGANSFDLIATVSIGGSTVADAALSAAGTIGIAYVDNATSDLKFIRLGSSFDAAATSAAVTVASSANYIECWVYSDPVGRLYVYGRVDNRERIDVFFSDDDGVTWTDMGCGLYHTGTADTTAYLTAGKIVHSRGSGYFIHQWEGDASTDNENAGVARLGGFSNVVHRATSDSTNVYENERNRFSWGRESSGVLVDSTTYLPIEVLDSIPGWTATGAGTGSVSTGQYLRIQTTANTRYYDWATTNQENISCMFQISVNEAGSLSAHQQGVQIRLSDGTDYQEVGIYCTKTQFRVYDVVGASTLATVSADLDAASASNQGILIWVLWNMSNTGSDSRIEVYYKTLSSATWSVAYQSSTALTDAVGTTGYVRVGTSSASTSDTRIRMIGIAASGSLSDMWSSYASTDTNVDRSTWAIGRVINGNPCPIYDIVTEQTYLRATDGPGRFGDSYTIAPAYDYPASNIDCTVSTSPRAKWRSTDDTEQIFAWTPEGTYDTSLTRHIGVALLGVNFESAVLEGWTGAAWTSLLSISLKRRLSGLKYARTGNVLRIDAGGSAADRYIWRNELVGAHVDLGSSKVRKIQSHTEGLWADTAGKHVEILIDGVDGTEPSTGTLDIWPHSGYSVAHGISAMYDKYRLRIPAQTTAENYFEAGNIIIGEVMTFGFQPSWGSNYKWEPNVETFEDRSGTTRYRSLGPTKRSWTLAWTDEEDWTNIRDMTPDYFAHEVTTEGMANLGDAPMQLAGLLEQLKSGEVPIVALANINTTSERAINDPTLFLYGRLVSSVQIENVQGDEGDDEVHRVQSITIESIV